MALELRSVAFEEGAMMPSRYTCDGDDVSPPLAWTDVPDAAASLALIMEDVNSVKGVWSHWVVYDIPTEVNAFADRIPPAATLPSGGFQGRNDFDDVGYGGPCPSDGKEHRYVFRLYALDMRLQLGAGATRVQVLSAVEGHVIERGEREARYQRLKDR